MKERNEISFLRSEDPEKLIVFRAASMKDRIRFYLNNTVFWEAVESNDGYSVVLSEDSENDNTIKLEFKKIMKFLIVGIVISLLTVLIPLRVLSKYISNSIYESTVMFYVGPIICIYAIFILWIFTRMSVDQNWRSKHSAEHMMVNFLEKEKRLPKSIDEVRRYSRFSSECGTRIRTRAILEELMINTIAAIICRIVEILFIKSSVIYVVIFAVYILSRIIIKKGKFNFIINPINKVLSYFVQCANTTKNVSDNDIILAYLAAKQWIQDVYPEFYNEEDEWKVNYSELL